MADPTTTEEQPITSGIAFSEEELSELEEEFQAPEEDEEDDPEDEDEEGETEDDEDEEEGEESEEEEDEDSEEREGGEVLEVEEGEKGKDAPVDEGKAGADKEKTEGYELLVDGQDIFVKDEEELAAWAQKGIHYEKVDSQRQKLVDDATFTMNAMINDPMASLEEIWTSKYSGNHEQARQHVARLAEQYLEPIWRELTAEPAQRLKLQEQRFTERTQKSTAQQQQNAQGQFSQEDIQFVQTMDAQIGNALEAVDLPQESVPLRKWMADVMRDGLDRGIHPDPRAAAEFIKSQQNERQTALGNSAPDKDRKRTGGKKNTAAKIAKAKARRSSRQGGKAPPGKKRKEPHYMTTREWLSDLNHDLNLE